MMTSGNQFAPASWWVGIVRGTITSGAWSQVLSCSITPNTCIMPYFWLLPALCMESRMILKSSHACKTQYLTILPKWFLQPVFPAWLISLLPLTLPGWSCFECRSLSRNWIHEWWSLWSHLIWSKCVHGVLISFTDVPRSVHLPFWILLWVLMETMDGFSWISSALDYCLHKCLLYDWSQFPW